MPEGKVTLDILVGNLGRINFGPYLLKNKKGITEKLLFAGNELKNWRMYRLPCTQINTLHFTNAKAFLEGPVFKKETFILK